MSKDKKPQAGEWWEYNGVRIRIVGTLLNGRLVCEYRDGKTATLTQGDWWHHEPRCTGWDWQPEPEPEWFDLTPHDGHVLRMDVDQLNISGNVFDRVAGFTGVSILHAKYAGFVKFRCLLKDTPPELLNPVESPDDWVEITDPDHIARREIDCIRLWNGKIEQVLGLAGLPKRKIVSDLVCRRRDLPPIPEPKPATQREVLLYWYDGNVVGRYADCPPSDPSFVPLVLRDGKVFIETETLEVVR